MSSKSMGLKKAPEQDHFRDQMQAFSAWKVELTGMMQDFQDWLSSNQLGSPEIELRIYDALRALQGDQLNIAFVA